MGNEKGMNKSDMEVKRLHEQIAAAKEKLKKQEVENQSLAEKNAKLEKIKTPSTNSVMGTAKCKRENDHPDLPWKEGDAIPCEKHTNVYGKELFVFYFDLVKCGGKPVEKKFIQSPRIFFKSFEFKADESDVWEKGVFRKNKNKKVVDE